MKHLLIISTASLLLFSFVIKQNELVGIWNINNQNNSTEIWELKNDSTFNELEPCYPENSYKTLIPVKNGSWTLKKDTLTLTFRSEIIGKKHIKFPRPPVMKLIIQKENSHFLLYPLNNRLKKQIILKMELRK